MNLSSAQFVRVFIKVTLAACGTILIVRALDFIFISLRWPLSICLDASILRFESYSILHGQWPWRDILSINLPLTHYIHLVGLFFFGNDDLGFRLLDISWVLLVAFVSFYYLERYSRTAAFIGFALTLTLPAEATPYGAFQRETIMLPFWILGLKLAEDLEIESSEKSKLKSLFLFSVCMSAAAWIKPTSILLVLLILGNWIRKPAIGFLTDTIKKGATMATGFVIVTLLVLFPLFFAGLIPIFPRSWWEMSVAYQNVFPSRPVSMLAAKLFSFNPAVWNLPLNEGLATPVDTGHFTVFHLLTMILCVTTMKFYRPMVGFFIAGILNYSLQKRGFQYHTYPLWQSFNFASAILLGGLKSFITKDEGTTRMIRLPSQLRKWKSPALMIIFTLLTVIIASSLLMRQNRSLKAYSGTGLYNRNNPSDVVNFRTIRAIGELSDRIKIEKGSASIQTFEVSAIALGSVTRFGLKFASAFPVDFIIWKESPFMLPARQRLMSDLLKSQPEIIAFSAGSDGSEMSIRLKTFPELQTWMQSNYRIYSEIHEVTGDEYFLFVRNDLKTK